MRKLDLGEKLIIEIKKYSETKQVNTKRNINRINAEIDKNVETIYKNSGKSGPNKEKMFMLDVYDKLMAAEEEIDNFQSSGVIESAHEFESDKRCIVI